MSEDRANTTGEATFDRRWWMILGVIATGGAAIRIVHAIAFVRHPFGATAWIDEQAYWERAQAILEVGAWPSQPFYQDPLYPYLLALIVKVVGPSLIATRIVLTLCGVCTPIFVGLAARAGFGKVEGLIAATFVALHGPLVFTDCLLEKEGIGALFAAIALWLSALWLAKRRLIPLAVAAGTAWGLLALLRSNALLVGPLGVLVAIGSIKRDGKRAWNAALAFGLGFLAPIAPAVAVNASLTKPPELIVTTWQSGANFYIGNGPEATGVYSAPDFVFPHPFHEAEDYAGEAIRRSGRTLSPNQVSRFWFRQGLLFWRDHPYKSLHLLLKKLILLFNDYEVSDNHNFELTRLVLWPTLACSVSTFGVLFPAALLGLSVRRLTRTRFWCLVGLSTSLGLLSTAVFFVVGRYRIPWVPGLAVLAGAGIVEIGKLARTALDRHRGAAGFHFRSGGFDRAMERSFAERRALGTRRKPAVSRRLERGRDRRRDRRARRRPRAGDFADEPAQRLDRLRRGSERSPRGDRRAIGDARTIGIGFERRNRALAPRLAARTRTESSALGNALENPSRRSDRLARIGGMAARRVDGRRRSATRASADFQRAVALGDGSSAIDLALLTRDRTVLDRPGLDWSRVQPYRLRVARAILR